ncbi:MAG: CotH kinase family protein, partial [Bacteroidales bacterium]|nr:CotH kinase family protein [Bacteroidales bacterium]
FRGANNLIHDISCVVFCRRSVIHIFFSLVISCYAYNTSAQEQNVRINEIMPLNASVIQDADGDYSDWIEIYNPTDNDVSLENWCLSDDKFNLKKWKFPEITIKSNEYLLVFASGKNRRFSDWELHLNFRLHSAGENLAFSDSTGNIISEFEPFFPALDTNNSFGVDNGIWYVYSTSSPEMANDTGTYSTIPPPVFSDERGFYYGDFNLELSAYSPSAGIFYTTDGSDPDINSNLYTEPLRINTTTVVRAMAISRGLVSNIISHSYIFPEKVIFQGNNPAGYPAYFGQEGITDYPADYEMDPEYIIDSGYANPVKLALTELPVVSLSTLKENLFSGKNDILTGGIYMFPTTDWERPVALEYFDSKTGESFNVHAGIKIHGGASRQLRNSPKKSFRISFRSMYGPSKLNYPVFGRENAARFNNILLKAGYNNTIIHWDHNQREDATYINDIWMKDTQSSSGEPSGNSRYAHLYINGIYWGIFIIAERLDNDFCASYMRGDKEDFDVIKDYTEVLDGDKVAWEQLIHMVHQDVSQNENYYKIIGKNNQGETDRNMTRYLEVENLVDYMLINFYGGNLDWDHHNWVAARNRNLGTEGFRFFCWDSERTLEQIGENVVAEFNSN